MSIINEIKSWISTAADHLLKVAMFSSDGKSITINDSGQLKVVLDGKVCLNNTTSTPLLAGTKFEGAAGETLDYALIFVNVYSDVSSAIDGLSYYTSDDGVVWYAEDSFTIPAATNKTFSFQPNRKYFKVEYTNGGTDQTTFSLSTIFKKTNSKPSSHKISDSITSEDDAELMKAVLTGENPHGVFVNFNATTNGNFKMSLEEIENDISVNGNKQLKTTLFDSTGQESLTPSNPVFVSFPDYHLDAFRRFSVAAPFKLFEYSANHPLDTTRYFSPLNAGSGTVLRNSTKTQIELTTTSASGDKASIRTRRNIQYNKGNAQEIFIIYRPNPTLNRRERWGYFDDNNGIYFEHDGTDARLVIRSSTSGSVVNTTIERNSWDDPLDGTGPSGLSIDWTKQTVFKIDFGWLSSRGARFFVDIAGTFVLVHTYYISNTLVVPFMATANLPIQFEVENTGATSGTVTSSFTCFAVQSSGSGVQEGPVRILNSGVTPKALSTTESFVTGIRINSNFPNASLQALKTAMFPVSGTDNAFFKIIYNPTLTGATWTPGESGVFDYLTALTSYANGSIVGSGYFSLNVKNQIASESKSEIKSDLYIGREASGTSDALIIVAQTDSGTGSIFYNFTFKEFL